jgi:hypothetical protein
VGIVLLLILPDHLPSVYGDYLYDGKIIVISPTVPYSALQDAVSVLNDQFDALLFKLSLI